MVIYQTGKKRPMYNFHLRFKKTAAKGLLFILKLESFLLTQNHSSQLPATVYAA